MIEFSSLDGVLRVTLDHPARKNALNLEMVQRFRVALAEARRDDALRVLVLDSAVEGVFSLGMDLAALQAGLDEGATSPQVYAAIRDYAGLLQDILTFRGVSVAAVGGMAIGGGVDLLSACDIAIASDSSAFSIAQLRKGIFPLTTSGVVVPRIGQRAFLYWALSGQNWSAKKALSMGLISQIVPADGLVGRVDKLVGQILGYDAEALRLGIDAMRTGPNLTPYDRLEHLGLLLTLNCQIPREATP